jgi:hypothetical protein
MKVIQMCCSSGNVYISMLICETYMLDPKPVLSYAIPAINFSNIYYVHTEQFM